MFKILSMQFCRHHCLKLENTNMVTRKYCIDFLTDSNMTFSCNVTRMQDKIII